jgi:hypothetical protein
LLLNHKIKFNIEIHKITDFLLLLSNILENEINPKPDHHKFGRKSLTSIFLKSFYYLFDPNQKVAMEDKVEKFFNFHRKTDDIFTECSQVVTYFKTHKMFNKSEYFKPSIAFEHNFNHLMNLLTFIDLFDIIEFYLYRLKLTRSLLNVKPLWQSNSVSTIPKMS